MDRYNNAIALVAVVIAVVWASIVFLRPATRPPAAAKLPEAPFGHHTLTDVKDPGFCYDPEIAAEYPGGSLAWRNYLAKTLHYPDSAVDKDIEGTIRVQFSVGRDGSVSDVKAVSGPLTGGLREEAIRVIANSGKWIPARMGIHPDHPVQSYKMQPVVFKMEDDQ